MMKCWENDPDKRPTFTDLKNELEDMNNQHRVRQMHIDLDSIFGNQVVRNAISPVINLSTSQLSNESFDFSVILSLLIVKKFSLTST